MSELSESSGVSPGQLVGGDAEQVRGEAGVDDVELRRVRCA